MPSWLLESALSVFLAVVTLPAVRPLGDPDHTVYPLLHPRPPLASTTLALPSAAASRSPPSVHNSSPCACSRWLLLCSHPKPHVPASVLPPLTPDATPAGTVLRALANEVSENPLWSGNPADYRLPILGKPRLPPDVSEFGERKTLPRNSHTPGSSSSCAGDTVVDRDLPLHTPTRSPRDPTGPPHPTHSKPSDSLAASHEGLVVTANLGQEGRSCRSSP